MMLEFLGDAARGEKIRKAVQSHLAESPVKTPDRGGNASTSDVGKDIIARL